MIFLLLQLSYSSSSFEETNIGVTTPWTDYVKFLPKDIPLPTRWTGDEQDLLSGTSAEAALEQKLNSLQTEFEQIELSTQKIPWCRKLWWDSGENLVTINDWKLADAIYRSRAFELPHGVGHSMLPALDMANHTGYDANNARFQINEDGNAQLVVRADRSIKTEEEVTITYGYGGACEMIFSYGFLDPGLENAKELFLSFTVPDDDPLKRAKVEFAGEAPGVKIYVDDSDEAKWEGPLVWWACVNEEDGLDFQLLRQTNGATELRAVWKGENLRADNLHDVLMKDPLWEVFLLRAIVLVQSRVEMQGRELSLSQESFDTGMEHEENDLDVVDMVNRLRDQEMELLAKSYQTLETQVSFSCCEQPHVVLDTISLISLQKAQLIVSDTVRRYLDKADTDRKDVQGPDEDFS